MKYLLFFACLPVLVAQSGPPPAAIATSTTGAGVSAVLLATAALPPGTGVMPVVTVGRERMLLPAFQIMRPGVYPLATAAATAEISAYVTPPNGATMRLRSTPMLQRYQYDGQVLAVYGRFADGELFIFVGTSLTPVRVVAKQGKVEFPLKPSDGVTVVTVEQAQLCDSVVVRLKQMTAFK